MECDNCGIYLEGETITNTEAFLEGDGDWILVSFECAECGALYIQWVQVENFIYEGA